MKILVVGAGFSGAVVAHTLANAGHDIHVIDERNHIGGNAYDYTNKRGIRIHKYGPHLFHTNNEKVYNWVTQFGEWEPYKHKVKAQLDDGRYVTLPVNKETQDIVGKENIVSTFFAPYTYKMWGKTIEELDPSILKRVPVRDDDNEYYFPNDEYQILPKNGYTAVFEEILDHKNIKVDLSVKFDRNMEKDFDHIFNAMPIDDYFNYVYGALPYRSIKFHHVDIPMTKVLPTGTVNFTHDGPYTRVTEWKNLPCHGINNQYTTLTYEEPCDYLVNNQERYYPVKDVDGNNRIKYEQYKKLIRSNMTFIGRCGMYVYVDMHQAINSALAISDKFMEKNT
jgi:UDP-galactopyranose mutase